MSLSFFLGLFCLSSLLYAQELKPTRWPLYSQKPLLLAWNVPTEDCTPRHGISFSFERFQIVAYPTEGFVRQNLTMFYKERLGLYPYYETDAVPVNGGLPQLASFEQHLAEVPHGLNKYISERNAKGLAVFDWEEWRPLWIRNWQAKDIYREKSIRLIAEKNPGWKEDMVKRVAQQEFELSAKKFMLETLRKAKSERPNQLWGFYLFPDCYNHNYGSGLKNYTGRCPDDEVRRNNQLQWLWTESTALFPSIYLASVLKDQAIGRQFVRNRVKEGMRLASVGNGTARPVFVYTRPTYNNGMMLLSEMDLISTIGESVSLGAAGVILWGSKSYTGSKTNCYDLREYLRVGALGRYLLNVSYAAEQCSAHLCKWHGRCLRRNPDTDTFLHLSTRTHKLELREDRLAVSGKMDQEELARLSDDFQCQCYTGYSGPSCSQRASGNRAGLSLQGALVVMLTLILLQ
ncbi:hyaluronidase-2 isoform 1-T3 [Clarias gariepinus]|uniref:hyaluronidase-2 n=1 Tax=Clarias gariepinus TaxID=13013 RepID=UPI00234CD274|nr:hyaluronidase-2 [Clarias gariepinus]XP_053340056.1 hyaluronidase-2 [Clarias gariepinus]XP_053340057.1 hyaluronidase-2 [Clarias gariepinus]